MKPEFHRDIRPARPACAARVMFGLIGALALVVLAGGCATSRPPKSSPSYQRVLTTTGYCPCGICCNWRRSWWFGRPVYASGPNAGKPKAVGITASGTRARTGTIAADTSRYPFGTTMYVPGYGYGRVEDTGGDIKGNHIDLFFDEHKDALRWGRKNLVVQIWFP